jgi:hypothetical protein
MITLSVIALSGLHCNLIIVQENNEIVFHDLVYSDFRSKPKSADEEVVRLKKSESRKSRETSSKLSAKALKEAAKRNSSGRQIDRDKSASESEDESSSSKSKPEPKPKKTEKKRLNSDSDFEVQLKPKAVVKKLEKISEDKLPEKKITKAGAKPQGIQLSTIYAVLKTLTKAVF